MKRGLLASSALVGASLIATTAGAQTPSVGSNFDVSIDGTLRFGILVWDQDFPFDTDESHRGYKFQTDESEVRFRMRGTADNGLAYGFDIELHTQTDDDAGADEAWMFLEAGWGRIELGDQDSAADRMFIGGEDRTSGRGGFDGDVGDVFNFGAIGNDDPGLSNSSDHTKVTYFTPRWGGLQIGISWTPDESHDGGENTSTDASRSYENTYELGLSYTNTFSDAGVTLATVYIGAEDEGGGQGVGGNCCLQNFNREDKEVWAVGGAIDYMGFGFGVGYADLNDTGINKFANSGAINTQNGADAGDWLTIGLRYSTGPWEVGGGYFTSEESNGTGRPDSGVDAWFVGFDYSIVPGWNIEGDVTFVEAENINKGVNPSSSVPTTAWARDNDGTVFAIATIMSF